MCRLVKTLHAPSAVISAVVRANMSARRLKRPRRARCRCYPRALTGRRPTYSTLMAMPGPARRGHRDGGSADHEPRDFPCFSLQALAKPPSGANVDTSSPVKTFEHSQYARGAKVAGTRRMTSLHDPRAHEQRYVKCEQIRGSIGKRHVPPIAVDQEAEGGGGSIADEIRAMPLSMVLSRPFQQALESPRRRGAGAGEIAILIAILHRWTGPAADRESRFARCLGTWARPGAPLSIGVRLTRDGRVTESPSFNSAAPS